MNTFSGEVCRILPIESRDVNGRIFTSRKFWVEQKHYDEYTGEERKSNFAEFELKGQNCGIIEQFSGQKVTVSFVLDGSKYKKKDGSGDAVFNKVIAVKVKLFGAQQGTADASAPSAPQVPTAPVPPPAAPPAIPAPSPASGQSEGAEEEGDDLPF